MSSGPEGETMPSRPGRLDDGIGSDACVMQAPLDVAGGSIRGTLGCAAVYRERGGKRRQTCSAVRLSLPWLCHSRRCFGQC
jgi:hypothetical protein